MPSAALNVLFPTATAKAVKFQPKSMKPTSVTEGGIVNFVMNELNSPEISVNEAFLKEIEA